MAFDAAPRVSVIIPTYNRAGLLRAAIDSVLAQTFSDLELLVVDDGSTDDTQAMMRDFNDPRILYIRQENKGRSAARNVALARARGAYIAFLDSDDTYLPEKLALQVRYMDAHPDTGMVYTSAHCVDTAGKPLARDYIASVSGHIYRDIAFFRPVTITLPTVMVRRALLERTGGFDEAMHRFEDTDMWRRLSKLTVIDAMPAFTCNLLTHPGNSLAAQDPKAIMASLRYYAVKIKREDRAMGCITRRAGLSGLYYYYGRAFMSVPAWRVQALRLLLVSLCYWPPTTLASLLKECARPVD